MKDNANSLTEIQKQQIESCMVKMQECPLFKFTIRQFSFLRYLVDHTLDGNQDRLKGYTIGVEVFERSSDFDPGIDSIVRVEAGKLRAKLREYYEVYGQTDEVRFVLPKGSYAVEINLNPLPSQQVLPKTKVSEEKSLIEVIPSLAVLPFVNQCADAGNAYFVDGITDSLIFELSKLSGIFLISRQSSFAYRNKAMRSDEIGLELGVRYLLEGSVQRIDNRIRISVQLSDTITGGSLWTERYDRIVTDIFELQDEITNSIVKILNIKLATSEKNILGHEGTVSFDAYDKFMQGLEQHWKYAPASEVQAIQFYREALVLDPEYAAAHAWLSRSLAFEWIMVWKDGDDILDSAYEHARTAVQLNKYLPYAHLALGWIELWRKNGPEAIAACRKSVSLDSNSADGCMFLSMSLSATGVGEEALKYIEMGLRLSPNPSPFHLYTLAQAHYVLGNYEKALTAWTQGCEMSARFMPNHFYLCLLYAKLGRMSDCSNKREEIYKITGGRCPPVRPPWIDSVFLSEHKRLIKLADME